MEVITNVSIVPKTNFIKRLFLTTLVMSNLLTNHNSQVAKIQTQIYHITLHILAVYNYLKNYQILFNELVITTMLNILII